MGRIRPLAIMLLLLALWAPGVHAATADCSIPGNAFQVWNDFTKTPACRQCLGGREVACGTQGVIPKVTSITGMSGATAVGADAILGNSIVLVVSTEVKTTVTGAGGLTGFMIGDDQHPARWGTQTTLTAGATTSIANFAITTTALPYPINNSIVLTAIPPGATFSAGAVDITVQYTDGTLLGGVSTAESGKVKSDGTDTTAGYLSEELIGDGNLTVGVVDVAGNRKTQLSIGGAAADTLVKTDGTDTTAGVLVNELLPGNDLVCEVETGEGGDRRLRCRVGSWTKTQAFPAGVWSTLNCNTGNDVQLTGTKRKAWYIQNCAGVGSELHFSMKLPETVDCSIPIRLWMAAQWVGSTNPSGQQVTVRTQAWFFGMGEAEPDIMSTTLNGVGGAADTQSMTFNQKYVPDDMLTGNLVPHGTCGAGKFLVLRVVMTASSPTTGVIPNIAWMEGEPIFGLTRLSHR